MESSLGDLKDLVQQAHKVIGQSRRTRVGASSLMMPKLHLRKPVMLSAAVSPSILNSNIFKAQEHCRFPVLSPQSNNKMAEAFNAEHAAKSVIIQNSATPYKLARTSEIVPALHTD